MREGNEENCKTLLGCMSALSLAKVKLAYKGASLSIQNEKEIKGTHYSFDWAYTMPCHLLYSS